MSFLIDYKLLSLIYLKTFIRMVLSYEWINKTEMERLSN